MSQLINFNMYTALRILKIFILCVLVLPFSIQANQCNNLTVASWIIGSWQSSSDKSVVVESWKVVDEKNFLGTSTTKKKGSSSPPFMETLRLVEMSGEIFYLAKTPQNNLPIAFKLVECSEQALKFENLGHDFPNFLEYIKQADNSLKAIVSGKTSNGFSIEYKRLADDNSVLLIQKYVKAYNQKSLQGMMDLVSDSVKWMSVNQDKVSVETQDKKALHSAMKKYFSGSFSSTSQLIDFSTNGSYISGIEKASWLSKGKQKSQCSPVIYQIENNLIQNVWYFPAQPCT